jgi:outer membrane receptor for ferrienterochelin and colicin
MLWARHVARTDEMILVKVRLANLKGRDQFRNEQFNRNILLKFIFKVQSKTRGTYKVDYRRHSGGIQRRLNFQWTTPNFIAEDRTLYTSSLSLTHTHTHTHTNTHEWLLQKVNTSASFSFLHTVTLLDHFTALGNF